MEKKFLDQIIGVTGDSPYDAEAIERIALLEGGTVGGFIGRDSTWQKNQMVVIGRDDFVEEYLIESVEVGLRHEFTCQYLSQEAFWDFWLYDEYKPYYKGDPRIDEHEGLSFLASIGFKWPIINEVQGIGTLDSAKNWNAESILKSEFGYSVRKGLSEKTRRKRLENAVTTSDGLGLRVVVEHIAFLIRINQGKADESLEGALQRWKSDLAWLYKNHYENSAYRFNWPTY